MPSKRPSKLGSGNGSKTAGQKTVPLAEEKPKAKRLLRREQVAPYGYGHDMHQYVPEPGTNVHDKKPQYPQEDQLIHDNFPNYLKRHEVHASRAFQTYEDDTQRFHYHQTYELAGDNLPNLFEPVEAQANYHFGTHENHETYNPERKRRMGECLLPSIAKQGKVRVPTPPVARRADFTRPLKLPKIVDSDVDLHSVSAHYVEPPKEQLRLPDIEVKQTTGYSGHVPTPPKTPKKKRNYIRRK